MRREFAYQVAIRLLPFVELGDFRFVAADRVNLKPVNEHHRSGASAIVKIRCTADGVNRLLRRWGNLHKLRLDGNGRQSGNEDE